MLKTVIHPSLGEVVFDRISGHISKKSQNKVQDCLLKLNSFPWYFTDNTVYNKPKGLSKFDDISILGHMMIVDGKLTSDYFNALSKEINLPELIKKYQLSGQVIRSQANLFLKRDKEINPCPHIDFQNVRHMVVLYYVNDCDGDTIFYNLSDQDDHRLEEMEEWRRESPKKGDFVIFDGRIFHSPSCPVKSVCRSTLNFDFLIP
jgi:hypothetical protein